jgi:membrane protease YdiL (CAAX protease family)
MGQREGAEPSVARRLPTLALSLAFSAPLAVILCLEFLRSVWWTFAVYQIGTCLVAPAVESRMRGRGWRDHAVLLGVLAPRVTDGSGASDDRLRALRLGVLLGLATVLVTGGFLLLTQELFLDPDRLEATLAGWGVAPHRVLTVLIIMAVLNATAEELFWRGYLPGRLMEARSPAAAPMRLTILMPAILYASYHVATIGHLVGDAPGVLMMTSGVLGAGLLWGWLRCRTGCIWPPLLSHAGGVSAYLFVYVRLVTMGPS